MSTEGGERLKLRSSSRAPTVLIRYRRPEREGGVRPSDYEVTPVGEGSLPETLSALGAPVVTVTKRRDLYLLENVRIHLDKVEGLGAFLEFEAVVGPRHPEDHCRRRVEELLREFGILEADLVSASYSDLLLAACERPRILVTGPPGAGKTTLVRRIVEDLPPGRASGFYTEEVRGPRGRTGFRVKALSGEEGDLARLDSGNGPRVGRYVVDLESFERVALPTLAPREGAHLYVIDEIGKMELHSAAFVSAALRILDSPARLLATVAQQGGGLIESVKRRSEARLFALTKDNRDSLAATIAGLLEGAQAAGK
ncbi:MAG: CYTH domain-containing protein [Planctomycetes bacterium]|nr:CYTH domain-containing protein [Planctomycetota bacterium]